MAPNCSYKTYRDALHSRTLPVIPYMYVCF